MTIEFVTRLACRVSRLAIAVLVPCALCVPRAAAQRMDVARGPARAGPEPGVDTAGAALVYSVPSDWSMSSDTLVATIFTPRGLEGLPSGDSLAVLVTSCIPSMLSAARLDTNGVAPRYVQARAQVQPVWDAVDSALSGRAFIAVDLVSPISPVPVCEAARDPMLALRGVQIFSPTDPIRPRNDLLSVAAAYGNRPVSPIAQARRIMTLVRTDGSPAHATVRALRVYFAPAELGPDAHGRFQSLKLAVTTSDSAAPDSLEIPPSVISAAWRQFTPERLAALPPPVAGSFAWLPGLREPTDTALRRAAALYASDSIRSAALIVADRRDRRGLDQLGPADSTFSQLLLGSALAMSGDSTASAVEFAAATDRIPCLRLPNHPQLDARLDAVRPSSARCTTISPARELIAGLLVPGGAFWIRASHHAAFSAAAATAGALALSVVRLLQSQSQFSDYKRADGTVPVAPLLDRANATRRLARNDAIIGVGLWVSSALVGVGAEVLHARWVRSQAAYETGSAPAVIRPRR